MTPELKLTGQVLLGMLAAASVVGGVLHLKHGGQNATVGNLNSRIKSWWVMVGVLFGAIAIGLYAIVAVFCFASFMALREFLTLTKSRPSDYWPMFLVFYVALPLQYWLLVKPWYGMFAIFLPVYGFAVISAASALSQDTDEFLTRNARILFAMMSCVYGVSHAPAILLIELREFTGSNAQVLLYFVFVVQANDVLQYVFGKLFGKHPLAPKVSPAKTWEGFVGGGLAAVALGGALHFLTPFGPWWSCALSALTVLCGTLGGLVMSAVKRSLGAKDWGTGIAGHGGYMDRLDSLSFAAPVFFHVVRFFWSAR